MVAWKKHVLHSIRDILLQGIESYPAAYHPALLVVYHDVNLGGLVRFTVKKQWYICVGTDRRRHTTTTFMKPSAWNLDPPLNFRFTLVMGVEVGSARRGPQVASGESVSKDSFHPERLATIAAHAPDKVQSTFVWPKRAGILNPEPTVHSGVPVIV